MPLVFVLGLFTALAASAQEPAIPDQARLQAMSREELAGFREQIQKRIDGLGAAEQRLMRETSIDGRSQMDNRNAGGSYGQGFGSRNSQSGTQGNGRGGGYGRGGGRHR